MRNINKVNEHHFVTNDLVKRNITFLIITL